MKIITKYVHGSADSTDTDVYYVVDSIPEFKEAKAFCDSIKDENANLIEVHNGIVTKVYKGTPDECNNSLFMTFDLHPENNDKEELVTEIVERDVHLKIVRAVRIILSHMSRSQYRTEIKKCLNSGGMSSRLTCLHNIDLATIDFDSCNKNMSGADVLKIIAFQLSQTWGLIKGYEIYTKAFAADCFPKLDPFLYRRQYTQKDMHNLQMFYEHVIEYIQENLIAPNDEIGHLARFIVKVDGVDYIKEYDLKSETLITK